MSEKILKVIGTILGIVAVPLLIYFGMKISANHDEKYPWKGSFYKIVDEENVIIDSDDFKNLDLCREWAFDWADYYGYVDGEYDYTCGTGCEYVEDNIESGKQIKKYDCQELTQ